MNLINITINTIHTITSPNNTIPVAPSTDTLNTTNAISNNNVNTKIENVIININLLSIIGVAFYAKKKRVIADSNLLISDTCSTIKCILLLAKIILIPFLLLQKPLSQKAFPLR